MLRIIVVLILTNFISSFVIGQDFRIIDLPFNDICYSPLNDRLYGILPGDRADGNAVIVLNPSTGEIEKRIPIGSEPSQIEISSSGRYLFVSLTGAPYLQRIDLKLNKILAPFSIEEIISHPLHVGDFMPFFNSDSTCVISRSDPNLLPSLHDILIIDNVKPRPDKIPGTFNAGNRIVISEDDQTVWGLGHDYYPTAFRRYKVTPTGLTDVEEYPGLIRGEVSHVAYQKGRIYLQNGQIFDVSSEGAPILLTTLDIGQAFNRTKAPQVPAIDSDHIFVCSDYDPNPGSGGSYDISFIKVFDKTNFKLISSYPIIDRASPWVGEYIKKIISLGKGRVAVLRNLGGKYGKLLLFNSNPCKQLDENLVVAPIYDDIRVCAGDSVELTALPDFPNYYWSNGQQGKSIKVSKNYTFIDSISFRVVGSNGCLSRPSPPKLVRYSEKPRNVTLWLEEIGNPICPDQKPTILANAEGTVSLYLWSNGKTYAPGKKFVVDSGGVYTVRAMGLYGCFSEPESINIIEAIPGGRIKPIITIDGPLNSCSEQTTTLSAPAGAFGYEWSDGVSNRLNIPKFSGSYAVRLLYPGGCKGPWSDKVDFITSGGIPAPLISQNYSAFVFQNDFFFSDSIQWFLNGKPIPNGNKPVLFSQEKGFYTVRNYFRGCYSESLPSAFPPLFSLKLIAKSLNEDKTSYRIDTEIASLFMYKCDFKWSDGSTKNYLDVTKPGVYCVTIIRQEIKDSISACIEILPNNQIEIQVVDKNKPISKIPVVAYQYSNGTATVIDTILTSEKGKALFKNLSLNTYFFQALTLPETPFSKLYFPTYALEGLIWKEATPITLKGIRVEDDTPGRAIITLKKLGLLNGDGLITGQIRSKNGFLPPIMNDGLKDVNGTSLKGISVFLYDEKGNPIAHCYTDGNGFYSFSNVPIGKYMVILDQLGAQTVSQNIAIEPGALIVKGVDFILENGRTVVVGVKEFEVENIQIWPNPTTEKLYVKTPFEVSSTVYNSIGQIMVIKNIQSGKTAEIDLTMYSSGVYFIYFKTKTGQTGVQKFIKE